jgi:pimeloyl-ACP methyl ester carboxylesterase
MARRSAARVAAFRKVERRVFAQTLPATREHRVTWSGGTIRTVVAGEGDPVAFLHGITGTLSNFASLAAGLVANHRCILVDLPGHGLSGPLDLRGSPPRVVLVESVREVVRQTVGHTPTVLVGNSLGGLAALYVAADQPELVAGVAVLGEPAYAFPGARARFPLSLLGIPLVGPLMVWPPPPPLGLYARTVRRAFGRQALEHMGPDALEANRLATRAGGHSSSVAGLMRRLMAPNGRARSDVPLRPSDYQAIDVPIWFLWGTDDPFMTFDAGRPWIESFPHATSDVVTGGHVPWFDAPDLARQRIEMLV